jgi:hypothetical protein
LPLVPAPHLSMTPCASASPMPIRSAPIAEIRHLISGVTDEGLAVLAIS